MRGRNLFSNKHPNIAEINEPQSTPNLACESIVALFSPIPAYDRSAMKIDTVSPIPHRAQIPEKDFQLLPFGSTTMFIFTATQAKRNTPTNLPITSPDITGIPTPESIPSKLIDEKSIPTFAKANNGSII